MARYTKANSIRLVSERAGVSVATVSRVVNNRTDVSEELRKKILSVIEELNFSPNKGVQRVFNIGVSISQESPLLDEYLSSVITGMATFAAKNPIELSVLFNAGAQKKKFLKQIRERRCDAVCLLSNTSEQLAELEKAKIPTMVINFPYRAERIGFLNNDSYTGAREAVEHLIGLGHKKIAFLELDIDDRENHVHRLKGYLDALKQAGISPSASLVVKHVPTFHGQEAGYLQAMELFRRVPDVTAVFTANDLMAFGVFRACWETKRSIPEDVSIVGFDDLPTSRYMNPPLTTVAQPMADIGYKAVNYLNLYLQGALPELPGEVLQTKLMLRNSTAAPKKTRRV